MRKHVLTGSTPLPDRKESANGLRLAARRTTRFPGRRVAAGAPDVLRVSWNGLAVGDHVLVHDVDHPHLTLIPGVVTVVETGHGFNRISVRLNRDRGAAGRVVVPQRLAVHMDPMGLDENCWRCSLAGG